MNSVGFFFIVVKFANVNAGTPAKQLFAMKKAGV